MAIDKDVLLNLVKTNFPNAEIELLDLAGDNNHYELRIADDSFEGLSKVKQHQAVYNALGSIVGNELHALALKTNIKNK
jgi:stress-induced morphogen